MFTVSWNTAPLDRPLAISCPHCTIFVGTFKLIFKYRAFGNQPVRKSYGRVSYVWSSWFLNTNSGMFLNILVTDNQDDNFNFIEGNRQVKYKRNNIAVSLAQIWYQAISWIIGVNDLCYKNVSWLKNSLAPTWHQAIFALVVLMTFASHWYLGL